MQRLYEEYLIYEVLLQLSMQRDRGVWFGVEAAKPHPHSSATGLPEQLRNIDILCDNAKEMLLAIYRNFLMEINLNDKRGTYVA
jgi:hypothetical protein